MQDVQDALKENLYATECKSGNVEVQWNDVQEMCDRYY
jgi:hypothetical protein